MNKVQERQIETYIGLSTSTAEIVYKLGKGELHWDQVRKQTQDNLGGRSLIVLSRDASKTTRISANLTLRGADIAEIYSRIIQGTFRIEESGLSAKAFKQLDDTQKIARLPIVIDLGLRSVHMKALRMIARIPGVSIFHLEKVFDIKSVIAVLVEKNLIEYSIDSVEVLATDRGINLLRMCAGLE